MTVFCQECACLNSLLKMLAVCFWESFLYRCVCLTRTYTSTHARARTLGGSNSSSVLETVVIAWKLSHLFGCVPNTWLKCAQVLFCKSVSPSDKKWSYLTVYYGGYIFVSLLLQRIFFSRKDTKRKSSSRIANNLSQQTACIHLLHSPYFKNTRGPFGWASQMWLIPLMTLTCQWAVLLLEWKEF